MFDPSADGSEFRHTVGLAGKFVVLYAGAHGLSNDLGRLLEAADQLRDEQHIAFVLLGDGMEKKDLHERAQDMNLDNLHFLPAVPKDEMAEVLAAADVCVAILKPLLLYKTVYPNKVFDYMAAGRPVILAIDGVIREVVEAAEAGIFVPPGDPEALAEAIHYLAKNPHQAREKGSNGRRYIEVHFDRAKLAEDMLNLMMRVGKE
jgi:glycosyltransferase involved in cell wall biosynthesis